MGFWDTAGRIGAGVATGGLSEAYRAANGGQFGPHEADLGPTRQVIDKSFGLEDQLAKERGYLQPQKNIDRGNQLGALNLLGAAASGNAPSPAEIMLHQQAAKDANQSMGIAGALQGRSPGGALAAALDARTRMSGDTNANAAALRANELNNARNAYMQGTLGVGGQTLTDQGQLLGGQTGSLGDAAGAAGAYANASAQSAASKNNFMGSLINGAGGILSDEREKTDVTPAKLDDLASNLKGFSFRYKDGKNGAGERVGVMAQDVAKSDIGKRIVMGGKRLKLDMGNAVGAALAMSAEALKRTQKAA